MTLDPGKVPSPGFRVWKTRLYTRARLSWVQRTRCGSKENSVCRSRAAFRQPRPQEGHRSDEAGKGGSTCYVKELRPVLIATGCH